MRRDARWLAGLVGTFAVACAPAQEAPVVDMEAETGALWAVAEAYHEAVADLDAEAIAAFYAEDVVMYPAGSPDKEGIAAVREHFDRVVSTPDIEIEFDVEEVVVSGDATMGYTLGLGEIMYDGPEGTPVTETMRDFHVWTKDAAGEWKLVVDIWNSPAPADEGD